MILLLDNYDSFVHNLARYFRIAGCETVILRSDEIDADGCSAMRPDAIVISPGPRRPEDAGCSIETIRSVHPSTPLLGVCLGHQAIAVAFGGLVVQCDPVHGMSSLISHDGDELFDSCPSPMRVGRYHSLAIDESTLPKELQVTARDEQGLIMAVQHRNRPIYGVQFHPESVLTELGQQLVCNFVRLAKKAAPCQ
jgi:anthranilate synthase/aminodeoxychorismate synthase-like glutamine amidotransferase